MILTDFYNKIRSENYLEKTIKIKLKKCVFVKIKNKLLLLIAEITICEYNYYFSILPMRIAFREYKSK